MDIKILGEIFRLTLYLNKPEYYLIRSLISDLDKIDPEITTYLNAEGIGVEFRRAFGLLYLKPLSEEDFNMLVMHYANMD